MAKKEIKSQEVTMQEEIELTTIDLKNKLHEDLLSQIEDFNEKSSLRKIGEAVVISAQIKSSIERLQDLCARVAYSEFAKADIPMVAAAKAYRYESYAVKEKVDKSTGITTMELKETNPIVNALALDQFCNNKACVDASWRYKAERLHCAIMLRRGHARGLSTEAIKGMRNNYAMTSMAKKYDEYEEVATNADPTSNNSMIKALQEIVNDMIGKTAKHKIQKKDVEFMLDCYTKEGDDNDEIKLCSRKDYIRVMFKICSKLETKGADSLYRDTIARADRPQN